MFKYHLPLICRCSVVRLLPCHSFKSKVNAVIAVVSWPEKLETNKTTVFLPLCAAKQMNEYIL